MNEHGTIEQVTIAIDGTPAGDAAIEWVVRRARTAHLEIELTAVVERGRRHHGHTTPD